MDFSTVINNHQLEYFEDGHVYLVDGIKVPSITQMLNSKFPKRYEGVSKDVLRNAANEGTRVHEAIEKYCTTGEEIDIPEVKNFRFLQNAYGFKVEGNEIPVILHWYDGTPIAAGRLDLLITVDGIYGLADIKRTSTLDKQYLAYQLNLYRIAYMQCYKERIQLLRGIHLRNDVRKFVTIPINKDMIFDFIREYLEGETK